MTRLNHALLWLSLSLGLAAATSAGAQAPAAPSAIPVKDFFRLPAMRAPQLSPSGKKIAMLVPAGNNRVGLAVADAAAPGKFTGVAQFDDADILTFDWVNDGRLVFSAIDFQAPLANQLGSGLYAVNVDSSEFLWLIERNGNYRPVGAPAIRPLPQRYRYVGPLNDGSDDVLVQRYTYEGQDHPINSTLVRLNTRALTTRSLITSHVPDGALEWVIDRTAKPRATVSYQMYAGRNDVTVWWREDNSEVWTALVTYDAVDPGPAAIAPVAVDHDGRLYVTAVLPGPQNAERQTTLHRYDTTKKAIDPTPVVAVKGFDFDGRLLFDDAQRRLVGVRVTSDAPGVVWLDESVRKAQEAIDKKLPATNNLLSPCRRCGFPPNLFIVNASSDRQSPVYFLYDRSADSLTLIGATRPWLDSKRMAEQDLVRIKARDGLEFPVYVTKPQGKGPWPTVVMVHGGPFLRGHAWGFEPNAQFLASRGYLVIEPEFRGSTGYGDRLFKAGWKQWGLAMQDDVTDATRWAIDKGLADAKRIAIAGASYGGYATMMGLVKEPALYRAGINWVGVTDIQLMYDIGWSDFMGSQWMRHGMPKMIGDPKLDAEQLRNTSPLQQAGRIKQPVLMAYGEDDLRVPLPHGTKMRDALRQAGNTDVEWVQYKDEGHGFLLVDNNVDFWTRVERFLARTLR